MDFSATAKFPPSGKRTTRDPEDGVLTGKTDDSKTFVIKKTERKSRRSA